MVVVYLLSIHFTLFTLRNCKWIAKAVDLRIKFVNMMVVVGFYNLEFETALLWGLD